MFNLMTHEFVHQKVVVEKRKRNVRKLAGDAMTRGMLAGYIGHETKLTQCGAAPPPIGLAATLRFLDQFACREGIVGEF